MTPTTAIARDRGGPSDVDRALAELRSGRAAQLRVASITLDLDQTTADLVVRMLAATEAGRRARVVIEPDELTTGQAADVLGVSRPTVVALVDRGELPGHRVGTHRRIRTDDLDTFLATRRARRATHLDEVAEQSADLGLYDD